MFKIGVIREGKTPPDSRVTLTPPQCAEINASGQAEVVVQSSEVRCYKDEEYEKLGVQVVTDVSDCDLLLGVKEVPIPELQEGKTYSFFSHTHKKQAYNRPLLQAVIDKKVTLIDHETLTDAQGRRLIAFGYFAGMVGAHNGIITYGKRTGAYELKRLKDCFDYAEAKEIYKSLTLPAIRVVLTGNGRVAHGAAKVLTDMGIRQVSPEDYLEKVYQEAVFTMLNCEHYVERTDGAPFVLTDFYQNPDKYQSIFKPYYQKSDLMINGIYWDNRAPAFFSLEEMAQEDFAIQVIADVTCDIAPKASIPSTIRASTIADPYFGFDPKTGKETAPVQQEYIDMMTIDNRPSELPRDASTSFGEQFIKGILPEWVKGDSEVIKRATRATNGHLGPHYQYLEDYLAG
ncbi:MAG TPA: alanine dehydrogenase, partial [Saprospiraceae bacterium]|nr:alanine dehydrogenase [Saprospiraceae bacterium]